jgi:hypothetical protein
MVELPPDMDELLVGFLALWLALAVLVEDMEPEDMDPEDMEPDDMEPEPMLF